MDNYLRITAQSTTKLMYTHLNHAVLCIKELSAPPYIAFKGTYDIIYDVINDITKIEQWKVPPKHTRLEISHRSLMHHSSCDILPPFPVMSPWQRLYTVILMGRLL